MTLTTERNVTAESAATDRRRPGRRENISPELIPILRTSEMGPLLDGEVEEHDQLSGMRGIFAGLALSVPIWVGVAYIGRWLLS